MIFFVQKCNWLCCNVVCHVHLRKIYNGKKLHLQTNLHELFAENNKQNYCGDIA